VRQGATKDEILDAAVEHVKVLEGTAAMLAAYRAVRVPGRGTAAAPAQRGHRGHRTARGSGDDQDRHRLHPLIQGFCSQQG
jgi:hypothetical protein